MLNVRMKLHRSFSNDVTVTAHILPCVLYVGMDVNQYIHQGAALSQPIHPPGGSTESKTNMATVEEIMIMFLLLKRQKRYV